MLAEFRQHMNRQKIFKTFGQHHDLVYFGDIKTDDDIEPIKGITYGKKREDRHYMHGNVHGHEVSVLERTTTLYHPHHDSDEYIWTMLQIDTQVSLVDHLYIDAHRYDELLYKNVFAKFAKLRQANDILARSSNPDFSNHFRVYITSEHASYLLTLLTPEVQDKLITSYPAHDIELDESLLRVYINKAIDSQNELELLLEEAQWLTALIANDY